MLSPEDADGFDVPGQDLDQFFGHVDNPLGPLLRREDYCRTGDTFVVWRLDRLGRNLTHVRATIEELRERGVHFRSLTEGLTDEGAMGKMMIDILGAFAEFERNVMIERTQAGLAAAHARGSKGGRRKLLDASKVAELKKLREQDFTVPRLAEMFHISEPSVYRYLSS